MSLNRKQQLDYTQRFQIRTGRVNFVNYAQRKQLVDEGRLLGIGLFPPDFDQSIIPIIAEGETNTTPEELARYLAEVALPSAITTSNPVATAPDPPTSLSGTAGNGQVSVSFTAPLNDGGSSITSYTVTSSPGGFITTGASSPLTVTGLTNGIAYTFTAVATNSVGNSLASAASSAVTPGILPGQPTSLSGVGGNQAIYILFTAGSDNGNAITNYQYSIDGGAFTAFSPAQTISPVLISGVGLANGTSYSIQLKAVNIIGASVESAAVSVTPTVTTLLSTSRLINLDSTNSSSYSGSGTTWTNLDSAGSYSATLNGSPTYNTTDPNNKYFVFNPSGSSQFAQITQAAAINPVINTPFTIQMWVRINNVGTDGGLFRKLFFSGSYDGYAVDYKANSSLQLHENGNTQVYFWNSTTGVLSSGWALYTVNIQFGNGGVRTNKIFVNGRQVLQQTSSESGIGTPTANLEFPIGFSAGNCDIGAFYYYNTELTPTQIIQNFDATKSRYGL
jgi:hypothetical protein